MVTVFVPSHLLPAAHVLHPVRVVEVPPSVKLPTGHTAQAAKPPDAEYWLSCPHPEHVCCPAFEYFPATHGVLALDPSAQLLPAGHWVHAVRVFAVPPSVNIPTGHVSQTLAPASAYFLSPPHSWHVELPAEANLPGVHDDTDPEVHVEPVGHTSHLVRVVSVPPLDLNPFGQVLHVLALA